MTCLTDTLMTWRRRRTECALGGSGAARSNAPVGVEARLRDCRCRAVTLSPSAPSIATHHPYETARTEQPNGSVCITGQADHGSSRVASARGRHMGSHDVSNSAVADAA